jgi:G8 domain
MHFKPPSTTSEMAMAIDPGTLKRSAVWLSLALLLASCGGGSNGDAPADTSAGALESPSGKALAAVDNRLPWTACAKEAEVCSFTGTQRVRYGAGTTWAEATHTDQVNCSNIAFGADPLRGQVKSCQTQEIQWQACAPENQTCNFNGRKLVRYGAADKWVLREIGNTVACNNATFGDPLVGTRKSCQTAALKSDSGSQTPPLTVNAWSNPATWGGTVPPAGASIIIPAGKTVLLDSKVNVSGLTVNGTLACGGNDIAIEAHWVVVSGSQARLACGTKAKPYTGQFNLVLNGPKTDNIMGMGARVLGAMDGGTIELFGEPRTGWTQLDATANKGVTTLTLASAPSNWRAGMDIVIGSSSQDPRQAEVRRIQAINGKAVTLASALSFDHFGQQQSFDNGRQTYVADTRAPVGLLSRNITIQGAPDSASTQFGAHMMTMVTAKAYVSDVGFNRVGQKSLVGRYPFHWHLAGDVTGQYITNSSIWESYNRCITIHGTDNALVENNVCYNHLGHGYFLEDGTEQGNTLKGNLGVLTVKPKAGEEILASDVELKVASRGPTTFWLSNPNNTVVDNMASGSDGLGYWYNLEDKAIARAGGAAVNPRKADFLKFENNTASAMQMGYSSCQGSGVQGMEPVNEPLLKNLTVFMTADTAVWPCGLRRHTFEGLKVLDGGEHNGNSAFTAPNDMLLKDALFVANSALSQLNGRTKVGRSAIGMYDQGFSLLDSHFVGYVKADRSSLFSHVGGAVKKATNRVERVTFSPAQFAAFDTDAGRGMSDSQTGSVLFDIDGSLGAGPNMTLLPRAPIWEGMECPSLGRVEANTFGVLCKTRVVKTRIVSLRNAPYTMFRTGQGGYAEQKFSTQSPDFFQAFSTPNQPYHFGVVFETDPGPDFNIRFEGLWPGDQLRYELRGMRPNSSVTSRGFTRVTNASDFESATGSVWFRVGSTIQLKTAAPASSEIWKGLVVVNVANE